MQQISTRKRFCRIALTSVLLLLFVVLQAKDSRPCIAVQKIAVAKPLEINIPALTSELEGYLSASGKYQVLTRQSLASVLKERSIAGGNTEIALQSADLTVTCTISCDKQTICLTASVLDVATAELKNAVTLTCDYDEKSCRQDISEMLAVSVKVLSQSKRETFAYALKLLSDGQKKRSAEIIKNVGTDFIPENARSSGDQPPPVLDNEQRSPEQWFNLAWQTHSRGDLQKARELFLACLNALQVKSFSDLANASDDEKQLPNPVVGKNWTIPGMTLNFRPIPKGTIRYEMDGQDITLQIEQDFWIAEREVSIADYLVYLTEQKNFGKLRNMLGFELSECPFQKDFRLKSNIDVQRPMTCINWDGAKDFARWLTAREKAAKRLPDNFHYRLPSENEWDYVARSGMPSSGPTEDYMVAGALEAPARCSSQKPDSRGIFDMYGNVWEWCDDWFASSFGTGERADEDSSEECKVIRGGGFISELDEEFPSLRMPKDFRSYFPTVGFRLVLTWY